MEQALGEYPNRVGRDPQFLHSMARIRGWMPLLCMPGGPKPSAVPDDSYATAIGGALPRAAGVDLAVNAKPSLLKPA